MHLNLYFQNMKKVAKIIIFLYFFFLTLMLHIKTLNTHSLNRRDATNIFVGMNKKLCFFL